MSNKFPNPSAFEQSVQYLTFRLMELHGRAPRTQATVSPATTLAAGLSPGNGRIVGFQMKAMDTGTTSSTTFNTVALYKTPSGSVTATQIGLIHTNRGSNGAQATMAPLSGATALVNPGDMLVIRRMTKPNTASQIIASVSVDKEVS